MSAIFEQLLDVDTEPTGGRSIKRHRQLKAVPRHATQDPLSQEEPTSSSYADLFFKEIGAKIAESLLQYSLAEASAITFIPSYQAQGFMRPWWPRLYAFHYSNAYPFFSPWCGYSNLIAACWQGDYTGQTLPSINPLEIVPQWEEVELDYSDMEQNSKVEIQKGVNWSSAHAQTKSYDELYNIEYDLGNEAEI